MYTLTVFQDDDGQLSRVISNLQTSGSSLDGDHFFFHPVVLMDVSCLFRSRRSIAWATNTLTRTASTGQPSNMIRKNGTLIPAPRLSVSGTITHSRGLVMKRATCFSDLVEATEPHNVRASGSTTPYAVGTPVIPG
jgi:hypothetical protein